MSEQPSPNDAGAMKSSVNPFTFVAATRYAIWRTLTSASELVATDVLVHADHIATEPGARGAILDEIEDFLLRAEPDTLHGTGELEGIKDRWRDVQTRLREGGQRVL